MAEVIRRPTYEETCDAFRWDLPARCNIAWDICDKWAAAEPERTAILHLRADDSIAEVSYGDLDRGASRLANALRAAGLARGERCGILLPQSIETAMTHIALYKLGAVALPLFTLFGEDGLEYRMRDAGVKIVVTDAANLPKLIAVRDRIPSLQTIYSIDGPAGGALGYWEELSRAADRIEIADTGPMDPAFISYTSGTTGSPKGVLHGHKVLLGHIPGVQLPHEWFPQPGDRMWTPADWAWMGGLTNIMMPALRFGVPLLAHRMAKFDPERAFWILERCGVRNAFMPPTALKLMRQVENPRARYTYDLRSVASGGEALGAGLLDWGREAFGLTVNEFYGQTECNLVLGNCATLFPVRPGSMGRSIPGHEVAVIDHAGDPLPDGEAGEIAVKRPDPVMFLEYWNKPEATRDKFVGDWMRTGDEGVRDADGYFYFSARGDDVIISAGYRVGPTEIEECLMRHSAVTMAAVVGAPDPIRTEVIKAYVVLKSGIAASDALVEEMRLLVRNRLSPHVQPREIEFIDEIPMTATGKVMRRELKRRNSA